MTLPLAATLVLQGVVAHVPTVFPGLLIRHELRFLMERLVMNPRR